MCSKLVSVIIPVHNAENYIAECLNSIIEQTYRNIEILIVDDGSTDNTSRILNNFNDERIKIIHHENLGASAAKNTGLKYAQGEYIQFLDADDILSKDKIEAQIIALSGMSDSIAVCKTVIINENSSSGLGEINTDLIKSESKGFIFLLKLLGLDGQGGMVQPNAYLVPREIINRIGPWDLSCYPCPDEDGEYFSRVLINTKQVVFTDGVNYYRKIANLKSLSTTYDPIRAANQLRVVEKKFKHIFSVEKTKRTELLFRRNVTQVAYQFGIMFPEIIESCELLLLGDEFTISSKNSSFKFWLACKIFGFKNTIAIKRIILR